MRNSMLQSHSGGAEPSRSACRSGPLGSLTAPRRAAALVGVSLLLGAMLGTTAAVAQEPSLPVLSVTPNVTVTEGDTTMVFTVSLDKTSAEDVHFHASTHSGTATVNLDFLEAGTWEYPGRAIPAGQRTARIAVRVLEDTLDEDTETFTLQVHNPAGATLAGGVGTLEATGTITDDTDPVTDLLVENVEADEGAYATFAVTLLTDRGSTVTVNYQTVNGTAVASRSGAPGDYEPASGTLEFLNGSAGTQYVDVRLLPDDIDEEDYETFGLRLSSASNASAPRDAATGLIRDQNSTPGLSVSDVEGEEGKTFTFTVRLDEPSGREVTARYATFDGSAIAGSDYSAKSGTLRFPPGVTERTVSVPTRNDGELEHVAEVFTLELLSVTNAYRDFGGPGGYGTIVDNEEPGAPPDTQNSRIVGAGPGSGGPDSGGPDSGGPGSGGPGSGGPDSGSSIGGGGLTATRVTIAPRIRALVNDAVLQIGGPPVELDLATVLGASTDSYRALAADPRVVTVVVSGSGMTLIPVAPGVTTVSVTAGNTKGSALLSFRVTVTPAGSGSPPVESLSVTAIERAAPTIVTLLGDRAVTVGDPPTVLDLAPLFGRAVGATYRALSDDPRLVTVAVSGSNLSLTGLTPGATSVSVSATNAGGVAMQTFKVAVRN